MKNYFELKMKMQVILEKGSFTIQSSCFKKGCLFKISLINLVHFYVYEWKVCLFLKINKTNNQICSK